MQDGPNHLVRDVPLPKSSDTSPRHRHDIDRMACTGQFLLSDEDRMSLNRLAPGKVQEWCLSRIAEHQDANRHLDERYGDTARKAISKNKSYIRALRTAYNDATPINRHLPPEMLMEIFSRVHPAVVPRSPIPVLRVCRYWRRLLFHTSEFWDNLLSLPTWDGWNPKYHMGRFEAALARSASASLTLSVPYYSEGIASILTPHARRLSSFKVAGLTLSNPEEMTLSQLKEEILYRTHRAFRLYRYGVLRDEEWYRSNLTFNLPLFPNLLSLELRKTYIHAPIAPYLSLCHLKLDQCAIRPSSSDDLVLAMVALHTALESFPNLEVLSLIHCLSPPGHPGVIGNFLLVPDLKETVHLPRLRHLELEDTPAFIPPFLSHLIFPATTALVLEPAYAHNLSRGPAVVPLLPRINPSASPSTDADADAAELSLSLHFPAPDGRSLARWETRGERVRPVRVTLPHAAFTSSLTVRFTRELADTLAPHRGVTALAVHGRYRHPQSDPAQYWEELTRALPELRRLACDTVWSTRELAAALGKRSPEAGGVFPCPRLGDVVLRWSLSHEIDLGPRSGQWRVLQWQDDLDGSPRGDPTSGSVESESQLAKELSDFCDTVGVCLAARAGHCEPIGNLAVALHCRYLRCNCRDRVLEGWQTALVEQRLRDALRDLVGDVVVGGQVS